MAEEGTLMAAPGGIDREQPWEDEISLYNELNDRVYIKHLYGPMFFGSTSHFQNLIANLDDDIPALFQRMDRVPHIDPSGLYAMEDAVQDLCRKRVLVLLTGLHPQPDDKLRSIAIVLYLLPEEHVLAEFQDRITWLKKKLGNGDQAELIRQNEIEAVPV